MPATTVSRTASATSGFAVEEALNMVRDPWLHAAGLMREAGESTEADPLLQLLPTNVVLPTETVVPPEAGVAQVLDQMKRAEPDARLQTLDGILRVSCELIGIDDVGPIENDVDKLRAFLTAVNNADVANTPDNAALQLSLAVAAVGHWCLDHGVTPPASAFLGSVNLLDVWLADGVCIDLPGQQRFVRSYLSEVGEEEWRKAIARAFELTDAELRARPYLTQVDTDGGVSVRGGTSGGAIVAMRDGKPIGVFPALRGEELSPEERLRLFEGPIQRNSFSSLNANSYAPGLSLTKIPPINSIADILIPEYTAYRHGANGVRVSVHQVLAPVHPMDNFIDFKAVVPVVPGVRCNVEVIAGGELKNPWGGYIYDGKGFDGKGGHFEVSGMITGAADHRVQLFRATAEDPEQLSDRWKSRADYVGDLLARSVVFVIRPAVCNSNPVKAQDHIKALDQIALLASDEMDPIAFVKHHSIRRCEKWLRPEIEKAADDGFIPARVMETLRMMWSHLDEQEHQIRQFSSQSPFDFNLTRMSLGARDLSPFKSYSLMGEGGFSGELLRGTTDTYVPNSLYPVEIHVFQVVPVRQDTELPSVLLR